MFEFFGGKKKQKIEGENSSESAVSGAAHFDGSKTEKDFNDDTVDGFYENEENKEEISEKKRRIGLQMKRHNYNHLNVSEKVSSERQQEKLSERNSGLGYENLVDELDLPEEETKEDRDEKHLNALVEVDDDEDFQEEDFDLEKAA